MLKNKPTTTRDSHRRRLRPLALPTSLLSHFLHISAGNTARNVETCGVLAGKLTDGGAFAVTALVIPRQTGTADTCAAEDEEGLLMFHLGRWGQFIRDRMYYKFGLWCMVFAFWRVTS